MNIFALIAFLLVAAVLAVALRSTRPEFSLLISLGAGVVVLIAIAAQLSGVFGAINDLLGRAEIAGESVSILLKSLGIAFAASFAADTCRDAGEGGMANKIELGGKIAIVVLCLPLFSQVLQLAIDLLNI